MNKPSRNGGGAMIAVAVIFVILILMIAGGGLVFFVVLQRSTQREAMARALHAEQRALMMAEKQRHMAEQQRAAANQQVAAERVLAERALIASTDQDAKGIARLGWLVNHWRQTNETTSSEEVWMAPQAGMMLGVNRSVNDQGQASFEYLRIESTENDGMVYYASPMGRGETEFPLLEVAEDRVVFENPAHDFPRRISYWLDDQRRLHARIEGEIDGTPRESEWTWSAVR